MAERRTQIQIPSRGEDEPDAAPAQLQRIRELTTGLALHGFRFDYRKLGQRQADAILRQLIAANDAQNTGAKRHKPRLGCVTRVAKGATAMTVWLVVLAGIAGAGYLIYSQVNRAPQGVTVSDEKDAAEIESNDTGGDPDALPGTRESMIFDGLRVAEDGGDGEAPGAALPSLADSESGATPPAAGPAPPPLLADDPEAKQQLVGLEKMLVSLSQFTRSDFAADLRVRSAQGMQTKLDAYPRALAQLDQADPSLTPRIRAAIQTFARDRYDEQALREEIQAIRQAIQGLQ